MRRSSLRVFFSFGYSSVCGVFCYVRRWRALAASQSLQTFQSVEQHADKNSERVGTLDLCFRHKFICNRRRFLLQITIWKLKKIVLQTNMNKVGLMLRLDEVGNCALFDGLRGCDGARGDAQTSALIDSIRSSILNDDSFTDDMRVTSVFERLQGFFSQQPERLAVCAPNVEEKNALHFMNETAVATFLAAGKHVSGAH